MQKSIISCLLCLIWATFSLAQERQEVDSLRQRIESATDDSSRYSACMDLALFLYAGEEAVGYALEALETARRNQWPERTGKAYYAMAWCLSYDRMEEKTQYLDSAQLVFSRIGDPEGMGLVSNTRAVMFMDYGFYDNAVSSFTEAAEYYRQSGDSSRLALIMNNWGACLNEMGQPIAAREKYLAALAYESSMVLPDALRLGRVYHGLAESSRMTGDLQQAADYHLKAYHARMQTGNIAISETLVHMAGLISEMLKQGHDTTRAMEQYRRLGFRNVDELLDRATEFPGMMDRPDLSYSILDARRNWALAQNDHVKAYRMLDSMKRLNDAQMLNPTSLAALANLRIQNEKDQLQLRLLKEEVDNQRKENQVNLLLLFLTLVITTSAIGMLWYQNRNRKDRLMLAHARQEQQQIAISSMLNGQEKERSRIARDLHDGLGNLLSSVKANMSNLQLKGDPVAHHTYDTLSNMIDEACTEVRKIAHEMMPHALKRLGLINALEDLVIRMNESHPFHTNFEVYGDEKSLDDQSNIMIFRIVQEAFNNIVNYAKASEVLLQMTFSEDWLNVAIEDNGVGFHFKNLEASAGMGLKSMEFRAQYLNGDFTIDSRPGEGTMISINIPLHEREA